MLFCFSWQLLVLKIKHPKMSHLSWAILKWDLSKWWVQKLGSDSTIWRILCRRNQANCCRLFTGVYPVLNNKICVKLWWFYNLFQLFVTTFVYDRPSLLSVAVFWNFVLEVPHKSDWNLYSEIMLILEGYIRTSKNLFFKTFLSFSGKNLFWNIFN